MKNKQPLKILILSAVIVIVIVLLLNKNLNNDDVSLPSFQKINLIDVNVSNRTDQPKNPFVSLFDFSKAKESVENFYANKKDTTENVTDDTADKNISDNADVTEVTTEDSFDNIKCDVLYVVDGDTICVSLNNQETRVRLIGINTPESVASEEYLEKIDSENSAEGKTASEYTKSIISNTVYLEFDEQLYDNYGRTLAYVYLDDSMELNSMLNYILYRDGYAELMFIEPNLKYQNQFVL